MRRTKYQRPHRNKYRDKPGSAADAGNDSEHTTQRLRNYYGTKPGTGRKK